MANARVKTATPTAIACRTLERTTFGQPRGNGRFLMAAMVIHRLRALVHKANADRAMV